MSTSYQDYYLHEFDGYNIDPYRYVHSSHSGKGRTKKEAGQHTNHFDPCGHVRKTVQKLINNSHKHAIMAK